MFYLLFVEITYHDLKYIAVGAGAVLLFLGALSVALKNIRTNWIEPVWKRCFSPIFTRGKKINDLVESVAKLTESSAKIEHEVLTNSGSSLKDSVYRIEKGQNYLHSKLRHSDHISADCLFETDGAGNFVFVNRALCELLGTQSNDLLNRAWLMRIDPAERERVKNEWKEAIENKISLESRQTMIDGRDGISYLFFVTAQPNIDAKGELLGFFGHVKESK